MNAQQNLGMTLYGARGADEDMNRFNAEATMNTWGLNDKAVMGYLGGAQAMTGPSFQDQLMAGGAGLAAFHAAQKANQPQQAPGAAAPPVNGGLTPQQVASSQRPVPRSGYPSDYNYDPRLGMPAGTGVY
jgi:hypothetical protein